MTTETYPSDRPLDDSSRPARGRPRWHRPTFEDLGLLRDCVQGGGKSVANADADPQSTVKQGGG